MASSVLRFRSRFFGSPRSLQPDLSCFPSRFRYSASCLFPFALPCFASHSCSASASLVRSLSGFSASLPVPFVPFRSASGYLAFCFFLSVLFPFPPHSGFSGAPFPLSLLRSSPFFPAWFPVPSFPGSRTRLPVRFLSSFPVSLPQPFHRCFPSFPLPSVRFSSGLFCLLSGFFRSLQPASDYSAFCSFFSLLPDLPWQRFSRCATVSFVPVAFLFRFACFHASLPIPVLSFLHFLSPLLCFVSQALHSSWPPVSSSAAPLGFRFRFGLLSF